MQSQRSPLSFERLCPSQQPSGPLKGLSQTTLQTLQRPPFIQEPSDQQPSSGQQPSSPLKGPGQTTLQAMQRSLFIQKSSGQQPSSPLNGPSQAERQQLPQQVMPLAQKIQRQPTSQGACMRTLRNLTKLPARQSKGLGGNSGPSEERWQVGLEDS